MLPVIEKLSLSRVLPVLVIVAAICFGIRFSDLVGQLAMSSARAEATGGVQEQAQEQTQEQQQAALAQEIAATEPAAGDAAVPPPEESPEEQAARTLPVIEPPSLGAPPQPQSEWRGAEDLDDEYSEVRMELFGDLAKRRRDIEAKERELVMREALLKAAQAELEQKYDELLSVRSDIEDLLEKQSEEEEERIVSLVKIYEGMKPRDAARIFDSLEMDVLLEVISRMSERRSAPIIAAMNPERARSVTIMLAEQNKLPQLPAIGPGMAPPMR